MVPKESNNFTYKMPSFVLHDNLNPCKSAIPTVSWDFVCVCMCMCVHM